MTKRFLLSIIIIGFAGLQNINGQTGSSDLLNVSALEKAEIKAIQSLNTSLLEFSPCLTDSGLYYIQSALDEKRIKREVEIDFRLQYATIDSSGNLARAGNIPELRMKGFMEGPVSFSDDNMWLYMTRNLPLGRNGKEEDLRLGIFIYKNENGKWLYQGEFPANSYDHNVCHPSWDPTSNRLIFASDMAGGFGNLDLYEVSKDAYDKWSIPVNLGPMVNGSGNDCFPFIFNKYFLFYSCDDSRSAGGFDIRYSVWEQAQWIENQAVPGKINSKSDDLAMVLNKNGDEIYFTSSRPGGKGKDDLYRIILDKSIIVRDPDQFSIEVVSAASNRALDRAVVSFVPFTTQNAAIIKKDLDQLSVLYNIDMESAKNSPRYITDKSGKVNFDLKPGKYILQVEREDFYTNQMVFSPEAGAIHHRIGLDSMVCKTFTIEVVDMVTGDEIENAVIREAGIDLPLENEQKDSYCVYKNHLINVIIGADGYQEQGLGIGYDAVVDQKALVVSLKRADKSVEGLPVNEGEVYVLDNILYALDDYALNEKARKELDKLAAHLVKYHRLTIELSSHTDSRGTEKYNQILSDKRVNTARTYLVKKGVEAWRIIAVGYGESRLKNQCDEPSKCGEADHAINRRTEVRIVKELFSE
jgi:outer membrane protein OmpA-like peptidoglycan-associated protein